jgi:hypothetical protein
MAEENRRVHKTLEKTRNQLAAAMRVLGRASNMLVCWDKFYGRNFADSDMLPPHGSLAIQEDIAELTRLLNENA